MTTFNKIGGGLQTKLDQADPNELVTVILLLHPLRTLPSAKPGMTADEREERIDLLQTYLVESMREVDKLFQTERGQRLSDVTFYGAILVETTPRCVYKLQDLDFVYGILENTLVERL